MLVDLDCHGIAYINYRYQACIRLSVPLFNPLQLDFAGCYMS